MAEIPLADYTGHLLLEVIKARQMADDYSRRVAQSYAEDPVLQHFPAPRFKLPKVELTIPVLVASAKMSQTARFQMSAEDFVALVQGRCRDVVAAVQAGGGVPPGAVRATPRGRRPRGVAPSSALDARVREFHEELRANPTPLQPEAIVQARWAAVFEQTLVENRLVDAHRRTNPRNELLTRTTAELLARVQAATVIERTRIDNLLVNPETNAVKSGSSGDSVFTLKVELLEEGVHVRSVRDEDTGTTRPVVEFD